MHSLLRTVIAVCCLALPFSASAAAPNLTILADGSLMQALAELARVYSTQTGTPLTVVRNDSADPARQLEQGYDAHILLSADPTLVERLAQRGLIDVFGTQTFASTQLALIAPERMQSKLAVVQRISFAAILFSQPELPIYVNDATTMGGLRAQALMEGREFSHDLTSRAQVKARADDIFAALKVKDGFALVLASTAVTEPDVAILSRLPASTSEPVRYDAVVLASESMEQAREFTKFLKSAPAQQILQHYGFQPANGD